MAYNGIDRSDAFFAHYGRKGMKRGMNIFNPNYKPVGEKAKGAMTGDPRYSNSPKISVTSAKPGAMNNDPRYSNSPRISVTGVQSSAKDNEREAYEAASTKATALSAEKFEKEKENATKKAKEAEAMEKASSAATSRWFDLQKKEKMKKLLDAEKAKAAEKARFYVENAKKRALAEASKLPIDADMIVNAAKPAIDAIGMDPETVKKGVETLLDGIKDELLKIRANKNSEVLDDAEYVYDRIKSKIHDLLEPIKTAIKIGGKALEKIQNTEYYQDIEDDIEKRLKKIVKLALTGKYSYDDMKLIAEANFNKIKENVNKQKSKAAHKNLDKALDILMPKDLDEYFVEEATKTVKTIMHSDSFDDLDSIDSFFAHHGIKGQKWGIRRYQNEDGTLTELGKKRYNKITEKYKNDKGEFSARKSTKASAVTALGGAATGMGLTLAGLPMVGLPVAAAAGGAAMVGAIKRERARRFLENTGTGDVKDISLDRRYATNFDFLGLGAIINTAYGTHREKVAERVKNELANTKMSEIKKSKEEPKKEASTVEKKEPPKKKEKASSKDDKAEAAFKTLKETKEYTSNSEIKKIEQLFKTAKTKEDLNKLYDSEKMEQLKEKAADVGGLSFDDVYKFVVPQLYKEREKELAHSGILGMKWGKRRFQNPDGSLTAEGRIRYLKGGDKAIRKAEKQRERRQAILSDRKKLYKHRGEFSKAEIDKAMEKFAAEDQLKDQMNAEKAAKQQAKMDARKARAALVQSKADYKKMKMQLKLNKQAEDLKRKTQQMQAEEQKKQAKLKTESDKLALESKQETADISAKAEKWKQRANKARSVYDFAKVGQEILSDMGITSKNGNESLFGALAESIGLKDNSAIKAAEARKKAIAKETEDLNLESLRLKVMGERRTFDNNYEEDRKKRAREGIEEAERQAKKDYQDKVDDAKLRQELAKAAKAEYEASNPNKKGLSKDDIEDIVEDVLDNLGYPRP